MRVTRSLGLTVATMAASLVVAAPPALSVAAAPPTDVTIVVRSGFPIPSRETFHFSCRPPRGNVPNPAKSCAAVAATPSLVTDLPLHGPMCRSPLAPAITAFGTIDGRAFRSRYVGGCWAPAAYDLLEQLGLYPEPPPHRDVTLTGGQRRSFSAASLRAVPHVTVRCRTAGSGAMINLPLPESWPREVTYMHHRAGLTVSVGGNGAVTARCGRARYRVTRLVAGQQATFAAAGMQSVARVIRCESHGSVVRVGSRVGQVVPPLEALYPRVRREENAVLNVTRDPSGAVTATCR